MGHIIRKQQLLSGSQVKAASRVTARTCMFVMERHIGHGDSTLINAKLINRGSWSGPGLVSINLDR
jgi:hypothetical protein